MSAEFQTVSDAELEQVTGGVTISLSLDGKGLSVDGPLGKLSVPNPFKLVGKALSDTLGAAGDLLSKLGGALSSAGHLFDFG
jgi:bacteriocin-like protein